MHKDAASVVESDNKDDTGAEKPRKRADRRAPPIDRVREAARGRWLEIYRRLAPELRDALDSVGSSTHHKCPVHGGENGDAFRLLPDCNETGGGVCNSCGGKPNGFIMLGWLKNWSQKEKLTRIGEVLGVYGAERDDGGDLAQVTIGRRRKKKEIDVTTPEAERARGRLSREWNEAGADDGRIAAYLADRGLKLPFPLPPTIRLEPAAEYFAGDAKESKSVFPAMIAAVVHPRYQMVSLHRTYLANKGEPTYPGKAGVDPAKKLAPAIAQGATNGAAVRLQDFSGEVLAVAEGIETALAVAQATHDPARPLPVWATISAGGMESFEIPAGVRRLEIWADNDPPNVERPDQGQRGQRAAAALFGRCQAAGIRATVITPATEGTDWLDVLRDPALGEDAIRRARSEAKWIGPGDEGTRHVVVVRPEENEVVNETIAALASEDNLFTRGGMLVQVVRHIEATQTAADRKVIRASDAPRIVPLKAAKLRSMITANVRLIVKTSRDGEEKIVDVHPPDWLTPSVHAWGDWSGGGIRPIDAIIDSPIMLPSGKFLDVAGYDAPTRLFYRPSMQFNAVPSNPTKEEVRAAVDALLEVVCDYPFDSPPHRSAWLAAVLTPLARFAFVGEVPLFLFDANVAGAGKSQLADVIGILVEGRKMARTQYSGNLEEIRKSITSILMAGDRCVLFDNAKPYQEFGDATLDQLLTASRWQDRLMGGNSMVSLDVNACFYATGNNLAIAADTARRVLWCRLKSEDERPEEREGFRHENLLDWVEEHRARLVGAACTILAGYVAAGRPKMNLPKWGSFQAWSDLIRGAIVWAGEPDPAESRAKLREDADSTRTQLAAFLRGWKFLQDERGAADGLTCAEVADEVNQRIENDKAARAGESAGYGRVFMPEAKCEAIDGILEALPVRSVTGRGISAKSLGYFVRQIRERKSGGMAIVKSPGHKGSDSLAWMVVSASGVSPRPAGPGHMEF